MIRDGVYVVGPECLDALLAELSVVDAPVIDPREFLAPDAYAPLPTIVQAARDGERRATRQPGRPRRPQARSGDR